MLNCNKDLRTDALDFDKLKVDELIKDALARAFVSELGHTCMASRRQAFGAIGRISSVLVEKNLAHTVPLPPNVLSVVHQSLINNYSPSVARSTINIGIRLFAWISRNIFGVVHSKTVFRTPQILVKKNKNSVPSLPAPILKQILAACYAEIEQIEARREVGDRILFGTFTDANDTELSDLLLTLLDVGAGEIPSYKQLHDTDWRLLRRTSSAGGVRYLNSLLALAAEDVLPFYIAILTQTSGNPDSILKLRRDCVVSHPLRKDLEQIIWVKNRSGREQRADFPSSRSWSATTLVRRLLSLTKNLPKQATSNDEEKLFLCRTGPQKYGVITKANIYLQLENFIKKHSLPKFSLRELRRAGAVEHHKAAGTLEAARVRLNHVSTATTGLYTNTADLSGRHDQIIRHYQGEIVRASRGEQAISNRAQQTIKSLSSNQSGDTLFGFHCKQPFAGTFPGTQAGRLCMNFAGCAICPGALIVLDDPTNIAKLISASRALDDAYERSIREGWSRRFNSLYAPTRNILKVELLPTIAPEILSIAIPLVSSTSIPHLE
jgi:hypothetical protein